MGAGVLVKGGLYHRMLLHCHWQLHVLLLMVVAVMVLLVGRDADRICLL